jgi:methoxymalonate biosynthesis protein
MIKCVIWDLDNTLLDGVYLESDPDRPPPADPVLLGVLRELSGRGIVHAIASRNPPEAAGHAARVTEVEFAAAECGWAAKPDAIRHIIGELGIGADAVAFVDDEPIERAEVAAALPEVLVLSPEDAADAPGWPEFRPAVVTAEARRRGQMYAQRRRREEAARAFGGSREEFLRRAGTRVAIGAASPADVPRLHELSVRTHQFNSTGRQVSQQELARLLASPRHRVITATLADDFGDDGLVGGCIIATGPAGCAAAGATGAADAESGGEPGAWTVSLVMMSCRAMGRGVIDALLAWLCRAAAADGAATVLVPCRLTPRNVPLRVALAAAGFRAAETDKAEEVDASAAVAPRKERGPAAVAPRKETEPAGPRAETGSTAAGPRREGTLPVTTGSVVFARPLAGPLPAMPGWADAGARR